uniref:Uncharacterized protein n=1 Tax=Ditylenchus dipsaci TaxID=166011 RepID=A0A915CPJ1_9BILA
MGFFSFVGGAIAKAVSVVLPIAAAVVVAVITVVAALALTCTAAATIDGVEVSVKMNSTVYLNQDEDYMHCDLAFRSLLADATKAVYNSTSKYWIVDCDAVKSAQVTLNIGEEGDTAIYLAAVAETPEEKDAKKVKALADKIEEQLKILTESFNTYKSKQIKDYTDAMVAIATDSTKTPEAKAKAETATDGLKLLKKESADLLHQVDDNNRRERTFSEAEKLAETASKKLDQHKSTAEQTTKAIQTAVDNAYKAFYEADLLENETAAADKLDMDALAAKDKANF